MLWPRQRAQAMALVDEHHAVSSYIAGRGMCFSHGCTAADGNSEYSGIESFCLANAVPTANMHGRTRGHCFPNDVEGGGPR